MNPAIERCLKCPVKRDCKPQEMPDGTTRTQTCPPQEKAVKLYKRLTKGKTSSAQTPNGELSEIKRDVLHTYRCPISEKRLFVDTLETQVNSGRNQYFNPNSGASSFSRPPEDAEARKYTEQQLHQKRKTIRP